MIPTKANRKQQINVQKAIYGLRNRIERFFNRLNFVARRHPLDKLIQTLQLSSCSRPFKSGSNLSTRPNSHTHTVERRAPFLGDSRHSRCYSRVLSVQDRVRARGFTEIATL